MTDLKSSYMIQEKTYYNAKQGAEPERTWWGGSYPKEDLV